MSRKFLLGLLILANVAAALLLPPGAFSVLFKTGPLAWDGSASFTLRIVVLATYLVVMFPVVLRAVNRQGSEQAVLV